MSWSVNAVGKADKVKEVLARQFEDAINTTKHIPAESKAVEGVRDAVNASLDHLIEHGPAAVKVYASGSASTSSQHGETRYPGSIQTKVEFETLYGFVE